MRPLFSRRRSHTSRGALGIEHGRRVRSRDARGTRRSKDPDRVAGGYSASTLSLFLPSILVTVTFAEAALANPNTTREGRQHAKHELEAMVRVCCSCPHGARGCWDHCFNVIYFRGAVKKLAFRLRRRSSEPWASAAPLAGVDTRQLSTASESTTTSKRATTEGSNSAPR